MKWPPLLRPQRTQGSRTSYSTANYLNKRDTDVSSEDIFYYRSRKDDEENICFAFRNLLPRSNGTSTNAQGFVFSDEGADVGMDGETNVSSDYKPVDNKFTGKIFKVRIDLK